MVAGFEVVDSRAHRAHHARTLVAEHDGRGHLPGPGGHVQIGVADARRGDLDPDLAGAGCREVDILDADDAVSVEDGGLNPR